MNNAGYRAAIGQLIAALNDYALLVNGHFTRTKFNAGQNLVYKPGVFAVLSLQSHK